MIEEGGAVNGAGGPQCRAGTPKWGRRTPKKSTDPKVGQGDPETK